MLPKKNRLDFELQPTWQRMKQANMMRLIYMTMFIAAFMPIVHSTDELWMRTKIIALKKELTDCSYSRRNPRGNTTTTHSGTSQWMRWHDRMMMQISVVESLRSFMKTSTEQKVWLPFSPRRRLVLFIFSRQVRPPHTSQIKLPSSKSCPRILLPYETSLLIAWVVSLPVWK